MEETKKPWESITLWSNVVMAILAVSIPEEYLSGEYKAVIITAVNSLIRYIFTKKGLAL